MKIPFALAISVIVVGALTYNWGFGQELGVTDGSRGSYVEIINISPDVAKPLTVGDAVQFDVEVEYTIVAPRGTVNIFVQREPGSPLLGRDWRYIKKGHGKEKLSVAVKTPTTPTIRIFAHLLHQDDVRTTIIDTKEYRVAQY